MAWSLSKTQHKRNLQYMRLQSQLEMDNWQQQFDAQNAYNDPSAQLERLEEAGINPLTQDGGFSNTAEGASGASVGLPSAPSTDVQSLIGIGSQIQEAIFKSKDIMLADKKLNIESNLAESSILQSFALVDKYKSETKHTDEDTKNVIAARDQIVASTRKTLSDIESSNVQLQISIQDLALRQYQTQIDEKYKAGLLDIEGRRNDISAEANEIKRAELVEKRREFDEQTKLEREKFTADIKNQRWDRIEKAMDKLHYETIQGVVTGIAPESLYTANGLLQALGVDGSSLLPSYRGQEYGVGNETETFKGSLKHAAGAIVDLPISLYRKIDTFYKDLQQIQLSSSVPPVDASTGAQ